MLHSKATAALMRLKEIDKKYKMRNEGRYTVNSSTESTLSSPSVESPHSIGDHNKLKTLEVPLKSKLDVRMPKTYIQEEEEDEEDKSHSITKEKVSSTIVINVETKSSENVEEELSNDALSSVIETDEKTSKKVEEKEVSKNNEEKNVEIDENNKKANEVIVETKSKESETTINASDINIESDTSNISSEIEELESPVDDQPVSYVNDTFEEALSTTSSTMKSREDVQQNKKSLKSEEEEIEDNVRFGVKKINIVLNKDFTEKQQEETSNEKHIVELVPPKLIENTSECDINLDKELSNYVKTIENIGDDMTDITPVCLLKPPKQPETFLKTRRKRYKRRPIVKDLSQSDKTTTESLTTSKNNRRSVEHTSFTPISGTTRMEKVHEENNFMREKTRFKQNRQWNIEEKKNKLPNEREHSIINENPAMSCSNNRPSVAKNLQLNKTKKKKSKTRTLHGPNKTADFNKDKFLRFDRKQIHCLWKQISKLTAEINLDTGSSSKKLDRTLFKPLDFPNIASYTSPDMDTFKLAKQNPYIGLHEKLAMIRQWLKDQYVFYQVRSNLVEIINEKHVPTSLEDAKTVIRELQKMTVEAR